MAVAIKSDEKSRFTDLCDESIDHLLSPIKVYYDKPVVSLVQSIQPIYSFFNELEDYVFVVLNNSQNPTDDLIQQEPSAIYLYTMQFDHSCHNVITLGIQS